VLLLSADAEAPPVMPFTTSRAALRQAIAETQATSGVADVARALRLGQAALSAAPRGLLVYVGPGMLDGQQTQELDQFRAGLESPEAPAGHPQFLVRLVGDPASVQNRGITRLSLRRDAAQPDRWHLLTQLKNYGNQAATVTLHLSMNGQSFADQAISLGPDELANAESDFVWNKGGTLQAEISPPDALDADNRAAVTIPSFRPVRVALFAADSPFAKDLVKALASNPYLKTEDGLRDSSPENAPEVAVYAGVNPPAQPAYNSIWFRGGSSTDDPNPVRVKTWDSQHPVTRWVRSHDVSVMNPAALPLLPGDTVLATADGNPPKPLIVAREQNGYRLVIIGFNPSDSNFALQPAFPLLIAGSVEWMTRSVEEMPDSFFVGELDLPGPVNRIIAPSGKDVPFALVGSEVHLLATEPGMYRVIAAGGESGIAVNTPALPAQRMSVSPVEAAAPDLESFEGVRQEVWGLLVALAIVALWLEWWIYYSESKKRELEESRKYSGEIELRGADGYASQNEEEREEARTSGVAS